MTIGMTRRQALRFGAAAVLAGALARRAAGAEAAPSYSFGIVPQQSAGELARLWTPFIKYLSDQTGYTLHLETAKDIATFERRLHNGDYDFAYSNPLTYALVHRGRGYEAFAKEQGLTLVGVLAVRKDSPYHRLADLAGTDLAFPAEIAMAASIIPRAHLAKLGVPFTPHYVGSHDSAFLTVAKGLFAAGGGVTRTFDMLPVAVRDQLRVLWTSPGYPSHPFMARRSVPAEAVARVRAAMVGAAADPAGQAALKLLAIPGFVIARDADYDILRKLDLKLPGELSM